MRPWTARQKRFSLRRLQMEQVKLENLDGTKLFYYGIPRKATV
jgi:hypothetical protein